MENNNLNIKEIIENSNEEKSFFSPDEARNLIENKGNSISGFNKYIKFKKGVVPMYAILTTVATFAAAAIMSISTFIDTPKENKIAQKQEIKQENNAEETIETKIIEKEENDPYSDSLNWYRMNFDRVKIKRSVNGKPAKIEIILDQDSIKTTKTYNFKTVVTNLGTKEVTYEDFPLSTINKTELFNLAENELIALGVSKNINGEQGPEISFIDNTRKYNSKPTFCKVFVNGGFKSQNENIKSKNTTNIGFTPTLITDDKGNRRLINLKSVNGFSTKTSEINKDGNYNKTIEIFPENIDSLENNRTDIILGANIDEIFKNERFIKGNGIKIQQKLLDDSTSYIIDTYEKPLLNFEIKTKPLTLDSLPHTTIIFKDLQLQILNLDSIINNKYLESEFMKDFEKNGKKVHIYDFNFQEIDSIKTFLLNDYPNRKNDLPCTINEFHINNDGTQSLVVKDFSKSNKNELKIEKNINATVYTLDDPDNKIFKSESSKINSLPSFEDINNSIDINKLIPIRVPVTKDFAFILWYEPTEEFISKLPENLQEKLAPELLAIKKKEICNPAIIKEASVIAVWKTCAGAIENLQISPNPTSGNINIKYTLQKDRYITISVNTIDGRKLFDLSENACRQSGFYEEPYNLKDLPPGVYLVSLKSDMGETAIHRIILE